MSVHKIPDPPPITALKPQLIETTLSSLPVAEQQRATAEIRQETFTQITLQQPPEAANNKPGKQPHYIQACAALSLHTRWLFKPLARDPPWKLQLPLPLKMDLSGPQLGLGNPFGWLLLWT